MKNSKLLNISQNMLKMALLIEEKYFEMLQEIFLDRLEKIKMSKD
jgi:hypothetical protein